MMNEARLEVGMQGLGHASAAYEQALEYARARVQSRSIWDLTDPRAQPVSIIEHPDIRRTLLWMKAYVDGLRALNYYVAYAIDRAEIAEDEKEHRQWQGLVEFLTPVCKAFSSDKGVEICSYAIDIHGGYGYCSEYPVEQYLRDVKIACIYEGTNGIQALDLVGRKLAQDKGVAISRLLAEIGETAAATADRPGLTMIGAALAKAVAAVGALTGQFKEWAEGSGLVLPILNARPFLEILGDLLVGWQLIEGAQVAAIKLEELYTQAGAETRAQRRALARGRSEAAFYEGKVAAARYFALNILPTVKGRCLGIQAGDRTPLEMLDASFG